MKCINSPCENYGNTQKGGKCNSCFAGKPASSAGPPPEVEDPYSAEIQQIVSSFSTKKQQALQNIDSFPEMHQVNSWLFIGDERAAGVLTPLAVREGNTNDVALENLRKQNINVVVCVSGYEASHRPFESRGVYYANALLSDGSQETKKASERLFPVLLGQSLPLIRAARKAGNAVLVHCNAGINRSCSTACAILMALDDISLAQAYTQIVNARVICQPSFHKYLSSPEFAQLCTHLRLQQTTPPNTKKDLAEVAI